LIEILPPLPLSRLKISWQQKTPHGVSGLMREKEALGEKDFSRKW